MLSISQKIKKGGLEMQLKPNKLKKALKEGRVVYGTCMCAYSPSLVELAGYCGFDFCRIDNEHAWRRDGTMEHMIRGAKIGDIEAIVRIDKGDPYLIRKVFEIGAGGIIVPDIKNADEVKEVVRAAKFPPEGERGFSNLCFAGGYGTVSAKDWIKWNNEEIMIGVMIETPEAVENIDSIFAVKGLDFALFGPADYSINIDLPEPDKNNPQVQSAIKQTVEVANKYGKYIMLGIGAPWREEAEKYIKLGIKMIEIGHDYSVLSRAWRDALGEAKLE